MKRYSRTIEITRPPEQVFAFFADVARLPEWAPEDFVAVTREGDDTIGRGTRFAFETTGAHAKGTFVWDEFESPRELAFSNPRLSVGPGWVEGLGGYRFEKLATGTRVEAWYEPKLGGFLALMSPFARMRNIRLLRKQLARAKQLLEVPDAP